MGALFGAPRTRQARGVLQDVGVPSRNPAALGAVATPETSMRFSALWAALRLRADLISTLPMDVFRYDRDGAQVPAPATPLFRRPSAGMLWHEWMYSSQMDLDRYGNCFGQIVAREAGYPSQIELWAASDTVVRFDGNRIIKYLHRSTEFDPADVWHERQYTVAGYRVGLSPLAYGAWAIGAGLAAQEFGANFYATGAHPSGTLRNTEQSELDPRVTAAAKARFKLATENRDIFVTGKEWEFSPAAVDANSSQFLAELQAAAVDVARFIGVPAYAIDAVSGASRTYSNVTQEQLHLLVNHLNPAVIRRELALTADALPAPRFCKLNTDALLRLDPAARTKQIGDQIKSWTMTPDEGRALENRPPLTPEDIDLLKSMTSKTGDKEKTDADES